MYTWRYLAVSADGEQFSTTGPDRRIRVFRFATGKLRSVIDESLESANGGAWHMLLATY
jgi:peptidylprolyl isomerase domain and WD repeat-containing protein 1